MFVCALLFPCCIVGMLGREVSVALRPSLMWSFQKLQVFFDISLLVSFSGPEASAVKA